jgi:hypothetical protein
MTHEEMIKAIETMTVIELSELVKALEDKFGVSASAPAMARGAAGRPVSLWVGWLPGRMRPFARLRPAALVPRIRLRSARMCHTRAVTPHVGGPASCPRQIAESNRLRGAAALRFSVQVGSAQAEGGVPLRVRADRCTAVALSRAGMRARSPDRVVRGLLGRSRQRPGVRSGREASETDDSGGRHGANSGSEQWKGHEYGTSPAEGPSRPS